MSWGIDQDGNLRRLRVDEEGRLVISCYLPAWETPVETQESLPTDDPVGTVRVVLSEPAVYLKSDSGWEKVGASDFLSLIDTPDNYEGQGGKVLRVNTTEDGIEFVDLETGVSAFIELSDVPSTYEGSEGKYLRVKTGGGIEFATVEGGGGGEASYLTDDFGGM